MTLNKIEINECLKFFVKDEYMPELVAWLSTHATTTQAFPTPNVTIGDEDMPDWMVSEEARIHRNDE